MKKLLFTISLLTFLSSLLQAQTDKVLTAYANSLNYEKNGDYKNAISSMMAVYEPDNYELNL